MSIQDARYAVHSLWLCIYSLVSVAVGAAVLTRVPQGTELLYTFIDRGRGIDSPLRTVLLLLSIACWALANWYGARLVLMRHFRGHRTPPSGFVAGWRQWFPRFAGVAGPLAVALFLPPGRPGSSSVLGTYGLHIAFALVALAVGVFVWGRRALVASRTGRSMAGPGETVSQLGDGDRLTLYVVLAGSAALMLAVILGGAGTTRFLGGPTLMFVALAGITVFGSVVLTYLPKAYGGPSLALAPLLAYLVVAQGKWNHNHVLSDRPVALRTAPLDYRPAAAAHFKAWLRQHDATSKIVIVAAEGGASRSAWWTSYVLGAADHATEGEFSRRMYAVSGVSGGSVGAATYVSLLARRGNAALQGPEYPTADVCSVAGAPGAALSTQAGCFLGRDFLSPVVGFLLFPDFFQRFWPSAHLDWDRSRGLEESWQRDWTGLFRDDGFGQPLHALYRPVNPAMPQPIPHWRIDLPVLLMNSAQASTGLLAVQSSVQLGTVTSKTATDLLARWPQARNLPLASLVHNSARFPVISPGGQIYMEGANGQKEYFDTLVDGGYFENSGAHGLLQLLRSVAADYAAQNKLDEWKALRRRFVVLFITNDPPDPSRGATNGCSLRRAGEAEPAALRQEELLTPIVGLYSVRTARGAAARAELLDFLNQGLDAPTIAGVELALDGNHMRATPPSMTWYMTERSRACMWRSLEPGGCAATRLETVFRQVDAAQAPAWTKRLADFRMPAAADLCKP